MKVPWCTGLFKIKVRFASSSCRSCVVVVCSRFADEAEGWLFLTKECEIGDSSGIFVFKGPSFFGIVFFFSLLDHLGQFSCPFCPTLYLRQLGCVSVLEMLKKHKMQSRE